MRDMARPPQDPDDFTMSFGDHLEELRRRLIYALIGVALTSCVTAWFGKDILSWLCQPLFEALKQAGYPQQVYNHSVAGSFTVWMKVSLLAGLTISAPWVVYQGWRFISTGLYASERKFAVLLAPFSGMMVLLGIFFLYYVFLPATVSFLLYFSATFPPPTSDAPSSLQRVTHFFNDMNRLFMPGTWLGDSNAPATRPGTPATQPATNPDSTTSHGGGAGFRVPVLEHDPAAPAEGEIWFNHSANQLKMRVDDRDHVVMLNLGSMMIPLIEINEYLGLVFILAILVLIAFQLPVVMTLAAAIGLLDPRWVAKYRKHIVFVFFVVGVIATPNQDFVGNILLPIVMWVLFELGLLTMRLAWKKRDIDEGEEEPSEAN